MSGRITPQDDGATVGRRTAADGNHLFLPSRALPFGLPETPGGHIRPFTFGRLKRHSFCFLLPTGLPFGLPETHDLERKIGALLQKAPNGNCIRR